VSFGGGLRVDGEIEGIPFAHSRRPSLVGSEGYSPTPLSCGFGEQQAAHGDTLDPPSGTFESQRFTSA